MFIFLAILYDTTRIEPKLSYIAYFEPGSGLWYRIYVNDVNELVAEKNNHCSCPFCLIPFTVLIVVLYANKNMVKPIIGKGIYGTNRTGFDRSIGY